MKIWILSPKTFSLGRCDQLIVSRDEDQGRRFHLAERDMDLLRGSELHCIITSTQAMRATMIRLCADRAVIIRIQALPVSVIYRFTRALLSRKRTLIWGLVPR